MSYKQCPFCGEKNIQRGYRTGVDLMTQDNRPWIGYSFQFYKPMSCGY